MKYRHFSNNGIEVSRIGVGAMSFSNFYGTVSRDEVFAILDTARDLGVNHIDTANIYGKGASETHIGAYLSKNPEAREFFHIASKGGITDRSDPSRLFNNEAGYLEDQLNASLARLCVEKIDIYYVHRRDISVPIKEVTETLAAFVKYGKNAGFCFSEISPTSLRAAHEVHPVAALQSEYSLSTRTPELGVIQTCSALNTTFVAFSPVGRSLLTDKPHHRDRAAAIPFLANNPRFMEPNLSQNIKFTSNFRALASDIGLTSAGLAISWCLAKGNHILPIPGTRNIDHFKEMVAGSEHILTSTELKEVENVLPIGWVDGDRYSEAQWKGPERYA
jgi:aryl-alcohol dehydrogenase-like predicted oxidoreductase